MRGCILMLLFLASFLIGCDSTNYFDTVGDNEDDFDTSSNPLVHRCEDKDFVCLGNNGSSINQGDILYFTVLVNNDASDTKNYYISINESSVVGHTYSGDIAYSNISIGVFSLKQNISISSNRVGKTTFAMNISEDVLKGKYAYTLLVFENNSTIPMVMEQLVFYVK